MAMQIIKGKINAPVRGVIYGPEGIGKSTFASQWPAPLFIDAERGTMRLDVDRVQPLSWTAMGQIVDELAAAPGGYKTLIFDTADWAEKMLVEHVLATIPTEKGKLVESIEGYGFGKGYTHLADGWKKFLDRIGRMQAANGMHVVFLAHAALRHVDPPDEAPYDRWEMKLGKQSSQIVKEWADLVLFLNYKIIVVETDGKNKAAGGKRVMYSGHHPCWDAKNRFELPVEMPLEAASIAKIFSGVQVQRPLPVTPPAEKPAELLPPKGPNPLATMDPVPGTGHAATAAAPSDDPEKTPLIAQLYELMNAARIGEKELSAEMSRKGILPEGTAVRDYNIATLRRVIAGWSAVSNNINVRRAAAKAA